MRPIVALMLTSICASAIPAHAQEGDKKWRDVGVYVDGKPLAVLAFGELPIGLPPVWIKERVSTEIEPGHKGPGYRVVEQRRYRFIDYLAALGVDARRVREIHVVGPRMSDTIVATGAELRSRRGRDFMFRFGGEVGGKPVPVVPSHFGNDHSPDKISAVMIYLSKRPPTLVPNEGLALDGKIIDGVPYAGEPIRGGVRVYRDNRLVLSIKRPLLRRTPTIASDGKQRWSLWDLLQREKVDTSGVTEAWIIRDERRVERLSRAQLATLDFTAGEKERSEILIGPRAERVNAIALHSRALTADALPRIRAEEAE